MNSFKIILFLSFVIFLACPETVYAFHLLGFQSKMLYGEAKAVANKEGYKWSKSGVNSAALMKWSPSGYYMVAYLEFCRDKLSHLGIQLSTRRAYVDYVDRLIAQRGQPQIRIRVSPDSLDPGSFISKDMHMIWVAKSPSGVVTEVLDATLNGPSKSSTASFASNIGSVDFYSKNACYSLSAFR